MIIEKNISFLSSTQIIIESTNTDNITVMFAKIFLLIAFLIFTAALLFCPTLSLLTFTLSSHVFCISTSLPHYSMSLPLYLFVFLFISLLSFSIFLCQSIFYSISPPPSPAIHLSSLSPPTLSLLFPLINSYLFTKYKYYSLPAF